MGALLDSLGSLLAWVWTTSWQAAIVAGLVLAAQAALGRWLSARGRYALWALVVARLLLPAMPASPTSLFNLLQRRPIPAPAQVARLDRPRDAQADRAGGWRVTVRKVWDAEPAAAAPAVSQPAVARQNMLRFWPLAGAVWLGVAILLLGRLAWANIRFARTIRRSSCPAGDDITNVVEECRRDLRLRRSPRVLLTSAVQTPAAMGAIHPTILLPAELARPLGAAQLRMVILHELAHIRYRDSATDWLLEVLGIVHWFNPVLWLAFSRCRADREMARDATALQHCPRQDYGQTILSLVEHMAPRRMLAALGILDGRRHLRRRIHMIARTRQSGWVGHLVAATVLVGASAVLLTGPRRWAAAAAPGPVVAPADAPRLQLTAAGTRPVDDEEPVDPKVQALLDKVLPEVKFDAVAFNDVVDFFRDLTGANIFVNWRVLEAAHVDKQTPVSVRMRNVKFGKALHTILSEAGGAQARLDFAVDEGVLTVSTVDDLHRATLVRVYDVREMLVGLDDMIPAATTRPAGTQPGPRDEATTEIIKLIMGTIAPDSWRENGGTLGAIQSLGGQLIVTQTAENHRQVRQLLSVLREGRSIQITVESRFIIVDEALAAKVAGDVLKFGGDGGTTRPIDLAAALLDGKRAGGLLSAVREDKTSTVIAAPRLTVFNGQRAIFAMTESQQSYVADYTIVKKDGQTRYEPLLQVAEPGLTLDLRGTVSADRKYVTLALSPKLTRLLVMEKRPYDQSPADQKLTVDVPRLESSSIVTSAMIPEGQTLLLGGTVIEKGKVLLILVRPSVIVQGE